MAAPIRILYVDDEPFLLEIGKFFLEDSGDFTVTTALSASEALRLIEQEKFDVIISDYQMPGMDGIQFLAKVRSCFGPIPFILFTGRGREEVVIQAINSGVDFYLQKGGDPGAQFAELTQKIKSAVLRKMAEIALRENERIHATMISNLPGFVYRCANDRNWTMEYISNGCREITGYSPDELQGKTPPAYNDLVQPEFQKPLWDKIQNFLEKRESFEVEYPLITKTGETRWVWERGQGIYSEEGQLLHLEGFITDITVRKQADEAIRTAVDSYRNIFLNSQIGLFRTDMQSGLLLDANDAFARFLGFQDRALLLAEPFTIADRYADTHDREKIISLLQTYGEFQNYEARFLKNDGSIIWMRFSARLVKENGWMEGVSEDITGRKVAEGALQESEEQAQNLLSQLPDIVMVHQDGIIVYVNDTAVEMSGFAREELIGSHLFDYVVPEARESIVWNLEKRAAGEPVGDYEIDLMHKSGALHHVIARTSTTVFNGILSVVIILIDITERKRAEVALEESENLYRTIFETTGAATIIIENDTMITRANAKFAELSGFSLDELEGKKSWTEFVAREDLEQMKHYHRDRRDDPSGEARIYEFRFVSRLGEIRHCINNVSVIPGTTRSVASVVDITKRKLAEGELRLQADAMEAAIDGMAILNAEQNYTYVNKAHVGIYGYENARELIGRSWRSLYAPDELQRFEDEIMPELGQNGHYRGRAIGKKKDGSTFLQEISLTSLENGGLICVVRDISERNRAEIALKESEQRYTLALEGTGVGLWDWDMVHDRVVYSSQWKRMLGYEDHEVENSFSGWKNLWHPDDCTKIEEAIADCRDGKTSRYEIIHRLRHRDGDWRWILTRGEIIKDAGGKPVRWVGTNIDITGQKRAELALERQTVTLAILNEVISTANKADDLPHLLNSILTESLRLMDFDAGGIYLVDRSARIANIVHSKDLPNEFLAEIQTVSIDKKPYDTLFIQNEAIFSENYAQLAPDQSKKFGFMSIAGIPLLSKGVAVGALNIASKRRYAISDEEKQTLLSIGRELGSTIERMDGEEKAKNASKNLETLFNSIDEMVFVLDMQGRILVVNNTVLKRLSYTPEELTGTNILLLHVPGQQGEAFRNVQGMITGTLDSCPVPVLTKDGTRIEIETKVTRGLWNGSEVLIWVSRDNTERKRVEEALKNKKQRLANIIEGTRAGTWEWNIQTGETRFNEQWAEIIGYTLSELSPVSINTWMYYAHPDDLQKSEELLEKHFLQQSEWYECESRMKHKNGSWVWVLDRGKVASWTKDKKPLWMFGTHQDITERKRAEEALHESEERYRSLYIDSRDAIMIVSPERGFLSANPATVRLFALRDEQEFKTRSLASMSPDYQPDGVLSTVKSREMMQLAIERGSHFFEWTHRRSDGTDFPATILLSRLERGGTQLLQATVRDITRRRQVEEALCLANKKLKLLSSITRHDITNQLAVLQGYSAMLEKNQPDSRFTEYFQKINAAAQRISSMIQFTREYEDIGVATPVWQDLQILVTMLPEEILLGKVKVKNDLFAGAQVFADPLIGKVFYNLMDNAVRYGGKITTIRFSDEEHDGNHLVVCEDDGDGIVADEKEKIFERGFGKNTGMGLALSKEILSITGILIRETGEPGKGARFEMTVPQGMWRITGKGA